MIFKGTRIISVEIKESFLNVTCIVEGCFNRIILSNMVMATLPLWEEISMMKVVVSLVHCFMPIWFWMHFSRRNENVFLLFSIANLTSKCVGNIALGFWLGDSFVVLFE